jgi:hypothetical protein
MRRELTLLKVVLLLALAAGDLVVAERTARAAAPTLATIRGRLRLLFADWDVNGDGYLDKEELAKAFRGQGAKPFDQERAGGKDKGGEGIKGGAKDKPSARKPDYKSYPDYLFLTRLDANGDQKISKKEWETWAKDYSRELRDVLKAQDQVQKAKARAEAATTVAIRRRALLALRRYQRALLALQKKQNAVDKKVYQAMTVAAKH